MTSGTLSAGTSQPSDPRAGRRPDGPSGAGEGGRLGLLAVLAVAVLAAACLPASLLSLAQGWRFQTAVSEVVIVPLLTVALLAAAVRRHPYLSGLARTAAVDVPVAGALVACSTVLLWVAPRVWPGGYWAARLDLLAFPLLVAAAVVLVLGVRALLVVKHVVAFAALVWTLPWQILLELVSGPIQALTSGALATVATTTGIATVVGGEDTLTLRVPATEDGFLLSVASPCSGTSSLIAFTIVGLAVLPLIDGTMRRKAAWLAAGLPAVWLGNLVRLVLIAWAGGTFGEQVAVDVLHPVAGLVLVNVVFAVMLAVLGRFGLSWHSGEADPVDSPLLRSPFAHLDPPADPSRTTRRIAARVVLAVVAVALLGPADVLVTATASPGPSSVRARLSFAEALDARPSWDGRLLRDMPWSKPYFGADSTWNRYRLQDAAGTGRFTVWADSITTSSWAPLITRRVVDCYRLHNYTLSVDDRVSLADGVTAQRLVYTRPDGERWHAVTWEWVDASGARPRYERMTLLASYLPSPGRQDDPATVLATLTRTAREVVETRTGVTAGAQH